MNDQIKLNPDHGKVYTKLINEIVVKYNLFAKFPNDIGVIRQALKDAFMDGAACGGMDSNLFQEALDYCSEKENDW